MSLPALHDLRVLELGALPAGALCARLFADFGADVLKLEPAGGDPGRRVAPCIDVGHGAAEGAAFSFLNVRKRSALLDASSLPALLEDCDVLVDSLSPAQRRSLGIDHTALQASHPRLVIAALSWFGDDGPYSAYAGSDLVCRALAGGTQLVGPSEGPPVPVSDHQAGAIGGLTAFIAAMASLQAVPRRSRRMAVSVHEAAITMADYNVALNWASGQPDKRWGSSRFSPNFPLGIYACKGGGWIGVTVVTPVQWLTFCKLLEVEALAADPRFVERGGRLQQADELDARFASHFLRKTADEWFELGLKHMLPLAVVPGIDELLASPEHRRRSVFESVRHGSVEHEAPASPLHLRGTPPLRGGAVPLAAEHSAVWQRDRVPAPLATGAPTAPLHGIRIVDLSMGWAGPLATRHFADLGADVIKVEAIQYPDWWRGVDNRPVVFEQKLYEKSSYFNVLSRAKRGITLDLTNEEGRTLLKELVRCADIVIENYSVGVLPKMGLDWPELKKANAELIMLSMPAFGSDGPWRDGRAYGSTLEQASGLPSVVGRPQDGPTLNHIAYGDAIGGLHAASALLVALFHKQRTGCGQRIELSQVECMFTMVGPWLVQQSAGVPVQRLGSRHPGFAPQGLYRCRGEDAWLAVTVPDDAAWLALCDALVRPDLRGDETLRTLAGRHAAHDRIDDALQAWTSRHPAPDAMALLQAFGVAAGVSRPPQKMLDDPHLRERGFWQWIDRAFVGRHPQPSPPYRDSLNTLPPLRPSSTLGQFNREVLQGILGVDDAALEGLQRRGVVGTEAVPTQLRKSRAAGGAAQKNTTPETHKETR